MRYDMLMLMFEMGGLRSRTGDGTFRNGTVLLPLLFDLTEYLNTYNNNVDPPCDRNGLWRS